MSINEYLSEDHRQIDGHLDAAALAAERSDWSEAEYQLKSFVQRLDRHIELEELELFPAMEARTGLLPPCQVMRLEHADIRRLLARLPEALLRRDARVFNAARRELMNVLGPHNAKEENILYPMADELLGPEGLGLVVPQPKNVGEVAAPVGGCGCGGRGGCRG